MNIVEVGARDGLQNEKVKIEINQKRFFEQQELPVEGTAGMDGVMQDMITPPNTEQSQGGQAGA